MSCLYERRMGQLVFDRVENRCTIPGFQVVQLLRDTRSEPVCERHGRGATDRAGFRRYLWRHYRAHPWPRNARSEDRQHARAAPVMNA